MRVYFQIERYCCMRYTQTLCTIECTMNTLLKILLNTISLFFILSMLTFWFPSQSIKLFKDIDSLNLFTNVANGLNLVNVIVSILYVRTFKHIDKSKKSGWYFYLIIFNPISFPIFLWKQEKEWLKEKSA